MVMDRLTQEERELKDLNAEYTEKYGFSTPENYKFKSGKGLTREVVEEISRIKGEPDWMLEFRLKSLEIYESKPVPEWGARSPLQARAQVRLGPPGPAEYAPRYPRGSPPLARAAPPSAPSWPWRYLRRRG